MECKFWLDPDNFEITIALEYNLIPQAKREINKIIYKHFDYTVFVHKVRYLRYARPQIAHLRLVNSAFSDFTCLDIELSDPNTPHYRQTLNRILMK